MWSARAASVERARVEIRNYGCDIFYVEIETTNRKFVVLTYYNPVIVTTYGGVGFAGAVHVAPVAVYYHFYPALGARLF